VQVNARTPSNLYHVMMISKWMMIEYLFIERFLEFPINFSGSQKMLMMIEQ